MSATIAITRLCNIHGQLGDHVNCDKLHNIKDAGYVVIVMLSSNSIHCIKNILGAEYGDGVWIIDKILNRHIYACVFLILEYWYFQK